MTTTTAPTSFWDRFGSILAKIALGAAKGALWASEHPTVVQTVSNIAVAAGAPSAVVQSVDKGIAIAGSVAAAAQTDQSVLPTSGPSGPFGPGSTN